MRSRVLLAGILLPLLLSGCFVSRVDPEKPELPLPAALPAQADTSAQLPDPWWTIFHDDTLDKLVEEALAHNADVAVAAGRVAEARAGLKITNADRLPHVEVEGNATRSQDSLFVNNIPGVRRDRTIYTVQGAVGYELDLWGKYQRASESARAALLNTEYGREATKLSLTGDVARGYYGLIAAAQQLGRARETLSTRVESLRLEKIRFDAGGATRLSSAPASSSKPSVARLSAR